MAKEIMNPKEAAEYLGISKPTLYKLIKNGEIPAKRIGKQWRIAKAVLDEIVKGGSQDEAR
ncbi:DNA-binding protein [Candidatus Aerophobetes bacterium]|uniref:DNA-binding protein n=1 Tax=Aerophobetes bacterium TaxID=2030807 RepID=A0A523W5F7_UNCAE|nr:MAG: DNA-binding protein [Candidatus Aerophobetes bacterium]